MVNVDINVPNQEDPSASKNHQAPAEEVGDGGPEEPLATTNQKAILVVLLVVLTGVGLFLWFQAFERAETILQTEYEVSWIMPDDVALKAGPATFWYDARQGLLRHRGPIDTKRKQELLNLLEGKQGDTKPPTPSAQSYRQSIGELAYKTNGNGKSVFLLLLVLGGLSGLLGVQMRSVNNLIGVACFKNDLRLGRWWPWYAARPLTGILVGVLTVVLVEASLLLPGKQSPTGTVWWLAIAFIAGFGATEFTQRLRSLSQTLFGSSRPADTSTSKTTGKAKPKPSGGTKPKPSGTT